MSLLPAETGIEMGELQLESAGCSRVEIRISNTGQTLALFTLLSATRSVPITLREGETLIYSHSHTFKYASFHSATQTVAFQLTSLTGSSEMRACDSGEAIESDEMRFEGKDEDGYCVFVAGNGTYSLSAGSEYEGSERAVRLRPGHPVKSSPSSHPATYLFAAETDSDLLLVPLLSPLSIALPGSSSVILSPASLNNTISLPASGAGQASVTSLSSYYIALRASNTPLFLIENTPVLDSVEEAHMRVYYVDLVDSVDVVVLLTAYIGDPDVLLCIGTKGFQPQADQAQFALENIGGVATRIRWEQDVETHCAASCALYVYVPGFHTAIYELRVLQSATPTLLSLNKGHIGLGSQGFYSIVTTSKGVEFALQGACRLFVQASSHSPMSWSLANTEDILGMSKTSGAWQHAHTSKETLAAICEADTCFARVNIVCESADAQYYLYVQQEAVVLAEGVSYHQTGTVSHFVLYNSHENAQITLRATILYGTDLAFYLARGVDLSPNATHSDWAFLDSTEITLNSSDPLFANRSMQGHYSLTIECATICVFELLYQSVSYSPTYILAGFAYQSRLAGNSTAYYAYSVTTDRDITISVTPSSGAVALYLLTSSSAQLPSAAEWYWTSELCACAHEIHISRMDPNWCIGCSLSIAVTSASDVAAYVLRVSNADGLNILLNGVPAHDVLQSGLSRLYLFDVYETDTVDVSATAYSGDVNLYIGYNASLSPATAVWASTAERHRPKHISISMYDARLQLGSLFVLVQGVTDSSYAVTAHMRGTWIQLVEGWPQVYSIERDQSLLFRYKAGTSGATCYLRPVESGFRPVVKARYEDLTQADSLHGFSETVIQGNHSGHIQLIVSSSVDVWAQVGMFSLVCLQPGSFLRLQTGLLVLGMVTPAAQVARYEVRVHTVSTLVVELEPCSELLHFEIRAETQGENVTATERIEPLRVAKTVEQAKGRYYVTVSSRNESESAAFRIRAQLTDSTTAREVYAPGANGTITWTQLSSHRAEFHWSPPLSPTSLSAPVLYHVYYSFSDTALLDTPCSVGLGQFEGRVFEPEVATLIGQTTYRLYTEQAVWFTVIATVQDCEVPYRPVFVQLLPQFSLSAWVYATLTLAILSCLPLVGCLFLARKLPYTRLRRQPTPDQSAIEQSGGPQRPGDIDESSN